MTYTLLRKTPHGWTDIIGSKVAEFDTEEAAKSASIEMDAIWGTTSEWRIVPTEDLGNYDLVA